MDETAAGRLHEFNQVNKENIFVPLNKPLRIICHFSSIVVNNKTVKYFMKNHENNSTDLPWTSVFEVIVSTERCPQLGLQLIISSSLDSVHGGADVIQNREDARGRLALDQLAHSQVVEEVNLLPLDPLLLILLLLRLQGQFNEDLLKFLVDKVDAELFEAVLLKNLKAVNIQNSDIEEAGGLACVLHCLINFLEKLKSFPRPLFLSRTNLD